MIHALDSHGSAVHPPQKVALLHIGEVASDRLGRDAVAAGEVGDINRALP